jgi:hypothetical protein
MMDSTSKGGLTREQILGAIDLQIEAVPVPEWGGIVYVRNLNGQGRDAFEGSRIRIKDNNKVEMVHDNTRAKLLSLTICDEKGVLQFSEDDVEQLGEKNASILDRLFDVAQRMSGLRPQDLELKVKNSGAAQTVNSSSVLHSR